LPSASNAAAPEKPTAGGGASARSLPLPTCVAVALTLLAAAALGLVVVPARAGSKAFLLLWLAVPLLRTMLPGMRHYDGIRHILEFTVPLALLAGLGLAGACRWLRARWPRAKWWSGLPRS